KRKAVVLDEGVLRTACERSRQRGSRKLGLRWAEQKGVRLNIVSSGLRGFREVGPRCSIGLDDAFGEKIPDGLTFLGNVRGKDVIKAAVLADDHDHVLDGGGSVVVA